MATPRKASGKRTPPTTKSFYAKSTTAGPKGNQPGKNINMKKAAAKGMRKSDVLSARAAKNQKVAGAISSSVGRPTGEPGVYGKGTAKRIATKASSKLYAKASRQVGRAAALRSKGK